MSKGLRFLPKNLCSSIRYIWGSKDTKSRQNTYKWCHIGMYFRIAVSLVPVLQPYHSHIRKSLECSVAGIVLDRRRDSRDHGAGCARPSKKITRYVDCRKYQFTVKQTENLTPS